MCKFCEGEMVSFKDSYERKAKISSCGGYGAPEIECECKCSDDWGYEYMSFEISFCPFCGRKMWEV